MVVFGKETKANLPKEGSESHSLLSSYAGLT